ncbi:hypothetical protein JDV02_002933 [Purpureocillium takamizusanense]|uniref:Uncharacterized protein n=1 Tax=Purpureocillium takamizusanense TaxID=2060973 RepID=A0A9Q8V946_9HYPO|nr:uncharacterized protein JDV02_002933 [Purpureocillium takamizusanense]UNI16504.1 hypothetical protein JDV02_002933 [Purpureocillium takamizusanense]
MLSKTAHVCLGLPLLSLLFLLLSPLASTSPLSNALARAPAPALAKHHGANDDADGGGRDNDPRTNATYYCRLAQQMCRHSGECMDSKCGRCKVYSDMESFGQCIHEPASAPDLPMSLAPWLDEEGEKGKGKEKEAGGEREDRDGRGGDDGRT